MTQSPSDMMVSAPNGAATRAHGTDAAVVRRVNAVGRLMLYSVTLFLMLAGVTTLLALVWLAGLWLEWSWPGVLFAAATALTLLMGVEVFVVMFIVYNVLVPRRDFMYQSLDGARVHVGLTSWNDREAVADSVREFKACPQVHKVIVADNNSTDGSPEAARQAGADAVVNEPVPGYGSCCMRALAAAAEGLDDGDVIVLCEGDMTFSAPDVKKMLAFLENCDLVLGTRATQELRGTDTQMDYLINPGNQLVAKLIQVRFWGTRLTDVGCTYRAMRVDAYRRLRDKLTVRGNHFSPHLFIEALKMRMRVIEIPVVFRQRVGESKGVGSNKFKAAKVALRMLRLLYTA